MTEREKWLSAAAAVALLKPRLTTYSAQMAICERAHIGLIRAHAVRLVWDGKTTNNNVEVPKDFWWAEGHQALEQNWTTGDFSTWVSTTKGLSGRYRLQAFGVTFARADIEKMLPVDMEAAETPAPSAKGGRPPADWWEDLLIDLCFKHFRGELSHKTQADIARVMQDWITEHGYDAAESTIKLRARKLWQAIKKDAVAEK